MYFLGTSRTRIKEVLGNLNLQFNVLVESKSESEAYIDIIKTNPYSLLANYTYDDKLAPLTDGIEYDPDQIIVDATDSDGDKDEENKPDDVTDEEMEEEDDESDVEIREHLIKFPKHSQFLLKFRNAKIAADRSKKKTFVQWRGYKASMSPDEPSMTYDVFKKHLLNAFENIKDLSAREVKVSFFIFFFNSANT